MTITINYHNKPSVIKYIASYASAKALRFTDNSIKSIVDRSGIRI